jgi:hypothetical protein
MNVLVPTLPKVVVAVQSLLQFIQLGFDSQ